MGNTVTERAARSRWECDELVLAHLIRYPHLEVTAYQLARKLHGYPRKYAAALERLRERGLVDRVAEGSPGVSAVFRLASCPLDVSREALEGR